MIEVNGKNNTVVIATAVAIATAATFMAWKWTSAQPSESEPVVEGLLQCHCGEVCGKFCAPRNTTPTASCHCNDCTGFAKWAIEEKHCPMNLMSSYGGVQMVQLYKNQFQWIKGSDKLRKVLLRDCSPLERVYASCCGTPIGFSSAKMKSFPLFIVYRDLLTYTNGMELLPNRWRMFASRVAEEQRVWKDDENNIAVDSDSVPASFIGLAMGRVLYGLVFGQNQPDPMDAIEGTAEVLHLNEGSK